MATHPQPPSFDEHLAELESHPLFMSTLPDDPSNNPVLGALQDLVHDGTPDGWCVLHLSRMRHSHTNVRERGRAEL